MSETVIELPSGVLATGTSRMSRGAGPVALAAGAGALGGTSPCHAAAT